MPADGTDHPAIHSGRTLLRVDAGAVHPYSVTRACADRLTERLAIEGTAVVRRDVSAGLPCVDGAWVAAAFADGDPAALAQSDVLADELLAADEVLLVAPVYNLAVPAALKLWIDQVVRAGRTFRFGAYGPEGLVRAERAWIVTASGGTEIGGPADFCTSYLRAILGFIGVHDVRVIVASDPLASSDDALDQLLAASTTA